MDQYVIVFEYAMLYYDMIDLIELIKESDNEDLKDYVDSLQKLVNDQTTSEPPLDSSNRESKRNI